MFRGLSIVHCQARLTSRDASTPGNERLYPLGVVNVTKALAVSSDVFFYTVGGGFGNIAGLGIDRLASFYSQFGLGKRPLVRGARTAEGQEGLGWCHAWIFQAGRNICWYCRVMYGRVMYGSVRFTA